MNKLIVLFVFGLFMMITSCSPREKLSETHSHALIHEYYTCSMHPQIKEDKPGKCPICHMNLTKIELEEDAPAKGSLSKKAKDIWQCASFPDVTSEIPGACPLDGTDMILKSQSEGPREIVGKIKLRKAQMKHFFPEYFPVSAMKMIRKIRLLGSVLQAEDKESNIPARVDGRVEKVFVKSTGSLVGRGDPVLEIYSPKLITAGEEYILSKKTYLKHKTQEFHDMLLQSEERLRLWGIRSFQFEDWFKQGKVPQTITLYSNTTGIVRKRNAIAGKYFKEGQNFFELTDLSRVWVEIDVYEHDSALVEIGQKVDLNFTALPGEHLLGVIDFINPVLDEKSRTLKIRTTVENNTGKLKPGMIANAILVLELKTMPLVIPRSAIIDTGRRKVVWVKGEQGVFLAKIIETGFESEGYVELKSGLLAGEEVVVEGNFLIDAQAQLFGGYEDFNGE